MSAPHFAPRRVTYAMLRHALGEAARAFRLSLALQRRSQALADHTLAMVMLEQRTTYRELVKAFRTLSGGGFGFDHYRDERTKTRPALLAYVLARYDAVAVYKAAWAIGKGVES